MRNKTTKRLFFSLIFCLIFGFQLSAAHHALNKVITTFSEKIGSKYGLTLTTSLELGDGKIREVSVYYSSTKPMDLEGTRDLIHLMSRTLLEDINKNAFLKPDLSPYPFTVEQVDITIFFRGSNGKYASQPNIAQVALHKGVIHYYKHDKGTFQVIHQEEIKKSLDGV